MHSQTTRTTSRRKFLGTAAGATGVAIAASVWNGKEASAASQPEQTQTLRADTVRAYAASIYGLELDGAAAGILNSVEGGAVSAEVIEDRTNTYFTPKHLGRPKYEDFTLQMGLSLTTAVYDWINAAWTGRYASKDGSIKAADYSFDLRSERQFYNALITETGFPACDAASKDPGYMRLRFSPDSMLPATATGKLTTSTSKQSKVWLPSHFRLAIDGLDCTAVNKVDAFSVKQSVVMGSIEGSTDTTRVGGKLEFPNLRITLTAASAQSWWTYHQDFVVNANNGEKFEKPGSLIFLASDGTEIARIKFFNMGLFRLSENTAASGTDLIPRVTAEMYVERMELVLPKPPAP
jgi:hypothetical protein